MKTSAKYQLFAITAAISLALPLSLAKAEENQPAATAETRAQMHDKMAAVHQKMAACLREGKPETECQSMMREECPMGKNGCMMGMGQGMGWKGQAGRGMGKGRRWQATNKANSGTPDKKPSKKSEE